MFIRNSSKALIISDGRILLNRCRSRVGEYYALPGGGQNPGESLEDAVVREVAEESGLTVRPVRLAAVFERISGTAEACSGHKLYFVFQCELEDVPKKQPTETDAWQLGTEWVPLEGIEYVNLFPLSIRVELNRILGEKNCVFLGSERKIY